jgi:hypothetical protein
MPRRGKVAVWAASPCLPQVIRSIASGRTRPWRVTSKKVLARKWRPTFFLLPGAKKVGRHKSSQIDGLCLETPAPSTEKWRFWSSKKRHSPPFFDDSARVCPRAYRTDRDWAGSEYEYRPRIGETDVAIASVCRRLVPRLAKSDELPLWATSRDSNVHDGCHSIFDKFIGGGCQ